MSSSTGHSVVTPGSDAPGAPDPVPALLAGPPTRLLIGGNWVEARSGRPFETIDQATERPIGDNLTEETKEWLLSNEAFSQEFFSLITQVDHRPKPR